MLTIARVFPRRTAATPDDRLAFWIQDRGKRRFVTAMTPPKADEVHISVAFTWDLPQASWLYCQWKQMGVNVKLGGPAKNMRGEEFVPGQYLRRGYVITSRGCDRRCLHCSVWQRDGSVRELPIVEGYNILDDNLLACSYKHVCDVIDMLRRQPERPKFTGGLEAARFEPWVAEAVRSVRPLRVFFAYDEEADWDPLVQAAALCWRVGFTPQAHRIHAYVLCGFGHDTLEAAELRMRQVLSLGVVPMAMVYRHPNGKEPAAEWKAFARRWIRPRITMSRSAA